MLDINDSILIHPDIGFGPKYINYERRIEYSTLAKEAIKHQIRKELKEEEMRLLYVALTRAREKLIITGIDKNLKKSIQDKEEMLSISGNKMTKAVSEKAKTYLDWIETVNLADERMKELIEVYEHTKNESVEAKKVEKEPSELEIEEREINENINKILTWKYSHDELTKIEGKSSVSKLAKGEEEQAIEVELKKPKFLEGELPLTKAEIGTIVHLIMQKLDFKQEYTIEKIQELVEELQQKDIITEKQKQAIPKQKILAFTKSKLFQEIANAKAVYQEKPFYINIPVKELYESKSEEKILVQGIIDIYYITQKGEIVLADYKTDYVPENDETYLIEKYQSQLNLYKRALEQATGQKVSNVYIYSTYLERTIKIWNFTN